MRLTLANLKAGRTPHVLGVCPTDERLVQWLNDGQQRLMNRGRWWGTVARAIFCPTDGCLTWPREVANIEATKVCGTVIPVRNLWYDFRQFSGALKLNEQYTDMEVQLQDRGMFPTVADISGTSKHVIAYATNAADETAGARILVQGRDENNQWIRTTDGADVVDGEWIDLTVAGTVSTNHFDGGITGVQKDETDYDVLLYQYSGTAVERLLGRYQPNEVNPYYRRSYIANLDCCSSTCCDGTFQVDAIVKLQHVPVAGDLDWFILQNESALRLGALSSKLEEIGETERAEVEFKKAIRELQHELETMTGQKHTVITSGHGTALPSRSFAGFI